MESMSRTARDNPAQYSPTDAAVHVFVYGTLIADEINDIRRAAANAGLHAPHRVGPARVPGRLVDFGDYPGLIAAAVCSPDLAVPTACHTSNEAGAPNVGTVVGDVYRIDAALLPVLDKIEEIAEDGESLFIRQRITVQVEGVAFDCFFYPIQERLAGSCQPIASGDWVAYRRSRPRR